MPFWNQNGIILSISGFQPENACMSFGLQKGSKFKSEFGNEKYGPWAFQNRPGNIATTARTIFRSP